MPALEKMNCPARNPPVRSARSRSAGEARRMVAEVHSVDSAVVTAVRAFASNSTLNDEVTQASRVSQLHPREGQEARSSFIAPKSSDHASPAPCPVDIRDSA